MKTIKYSINKFATRLTLFSALFGLLQVLIYFIYPNDNSLFIGFFHLYPTVLVHSVLLLLVIVNAVKHPQDLKEHFSTICVMLLNIPLAFACAYLVLELGNI